MIRGVAESQRLDDYFQWLTPGDLEEMFANDPQGWCQLDDDVGTGWIVDAAVRRRWGNFMPRRGPVVEVFQTHLDSDPTRDRSGCFSCGPAVDRGFVVAVEEMEHLGFHRFAWLGRVNRASEERAWIPAALAAHGAAVYRSESLAMRQPAIAASPGRAFAVDSLARWLQSLAPPTVLFCESAGLAVEAISRCKYLGIAIPEDVAVLSGEDDALRCLWVDPELSRMNWVGDQVGKAAVTLLREAIELGNPAPRQVLVPPGPAIHRGSSDTLAIADPDVATALRYIYEHATEGISVSDLLRHLPISRRSLEQKFRASLHRSPAEEIRRVRVLRARDLVERSSLSIAEIAHRCGFESCELFSRTFRKWCGMPPSVFRNRPIEGGRIDPAHLSGPAGSPSDAPQGESKASRPIVDTS